MAKRVLIIDDEADVVTYLSMILKTNGYEPFALNSAVSAISEAKKIKPDLICLDIMMPEETGVSFYAQLRQDKEIGYIPVIIISGVVQSGEPDFHKYLSDQSIPAPEAFMEKPINVDEYLATIEKLINRKFSSRKAKK